MDYDELKIVWDKYNEKLDNLEKMNKKIIQETLLRRPRRKLNYFKFQSIYGILIVPVVLIFVLHPFFKLENMDLKFIAGCALTLGVAIYLINSHVKSYQVLKHIDLEADTVLNSASKVAAFKNLYNSYWKYNIIIYPLLCAGIILIAWKSFIFDTKTILFLILFFTATYIWNIKAPKLYRNRIQRLEKEVIDLKEYMD